MTETVSRPRSLEQWLHYQQTVHGSAIDLSLERVRTVAARLGLLQRYCPLAIVAGTNGKGSTATALASLLRACGQRVGLFTSPHLLHYSERIHIDGIPARSTALIEAFELIESVRGSITLTFFEYSTLAALELFRRAQVEAIVLEVGLGGRLDATNILDADVALLCSVGLDHRDWLGDTLEQIGAEKAGIFRARQKVVLGSADMPDSVWRKLSELQCETWTAQRDFTWDIQGDGYAFAPWHYHSRLCTLRDLPAPALAGAIQYGNAASALCALQLLELPGACDYARVAAALGALVLPGRFQVVPGEIEWVFDVAHNEPAARVLARALAARRVPGRTLAVAGMLADKDVAAVARALDGVVDLWLLAGISDESRGLAAATLAQRLPGLRSPVQLYDTVAQACAAAGAAAERGDRIVALGSFHVVGPALAARGYTEAPELWKTASKSV